MITEKIVRTIIYYFSSYICSHYQITVTFLASQAHLWELESKATTESLQTSPKNIMVEVFRSDRRGSIWGWDSESHLITCSEQSLSHNNIIKDCRGIKKMWENPRRFRAWNIPYHVSSRANKFSDEYRQRIDAIKVENELNMMDNSLFIHIFFVLYCAAYNNCLWIRICFCMVALYMDSVLSSWDF